LIPVLHHRDRVNRGCVQVVKDWPKWAALVLVALTLPACVRYSVAIRQPDKRIAETAAQREMVRSQQGSPAKLGGLLDAAYAAWVRVSADQSDAMALADYNFAVARVVEEMERVEVQPSNPVLTGPSRDGATWSLKVELAAGQPDLEMLAADRFRFRGKLVPEPSIREGIGAPVIATGDASDMIDLDPLIDDQHVFFGLTAVIRFEGKKGRLEFLDPLDSETVDMDGKTYALAADFMAPLVFKLAKINPERGQLSRLLHPSRYNHTSFISRLQPYSPDKIPVLFVHGLANSPATWMPLLSQLRGDPVIRKNYQFWFFSHPTGIPYPITAAELREELDDIRKNFPGHKDIVVVGHSMGGMISRLLMTDSKMTLWDTFYERSPDEIPFSNETRRVVTDTLIFESRDDISRVIFVAASHGGSYHATNLTGRIGAFLVGNPIANDEINREATAYFRAEQQIRGRRRLPNSIEALDPDSQWIQALHDLPLDRSTPFQSIMGDRGRGGNHDRTGPQSTDGVVPFWSAHLDGAESEMTVPSDHWIHLHPEGQAEIHRLLLEHLD
jgi:hypothetical protein